MRLDIAGGTPVGWSGPRDGAGRRRPDGDRPALRRPPGQRAGAIRRRVSLDALEDRRDPLFAVSADATTTAAAPSLMPDALPGVTVPFFSNRATSLASASGVESGRMCSSLSTTTSPFFVFTVTGTISSPKRHDSRAFAASMWLRYANSSAASRVIPYLRPRFSAVFAMPRPLYESTRATQR